jgi:hypothetical protein
MTDAIELKEGKDQKMVSKLRTNYFRLDSFKEISWMGYAWAL